MLLWQPELDGRRSIDRFLRLRLATSMLASSTREAPGQARATLAKGEAVEVAGYLLAPELALAIDGVSAAALLPAVPVYWLNYQAPEQTCAPVPPLARQWREHGAAVHVASFGDGPFWHSGELLACPQLLDATGKLCHDWLGEERTRP